MKVQANCIYYTAVDDDQLDDTLVDKVICHP